MSETIEATSTKTYNTIIYDNTFKFVCKPCEREYLDTEVFLNGSLFCCISWPEREAFLKDFTKFMEKYRI